MAADLSPRAALVALAITGSAAAALALPAASEPPVPITRERTDESLRSRATVSIREQQLADAIAAVSAATGLKITPRWSDALGIETMDPEQEISLELRDAPAATILERLTAEASAASPADLAWQMIGAGEIELGPKSVLNRRRTMRLYDVRDLVVHVPDFDEPARLDLNAALAQSGGGGVGCFTDGSYRPEAPPAEERTDEVIDLICAMVESGQWTHLGGDGATVRRHGESIVVLAPGYIHRQIAGLTRD